MTPAATAPGGLHVVQRIVPQGRYQQDYDLAGLIPGVAHFHATDADYTRLLITIAAQTKVNEATATRL